MSVTCMFNVMIPTRDGAELPADIYLPERTGKFPFIVLRSPYQPEGNVYSDFCADFCADGIGVLVQDCRGTGRSTLEADFFRQERDDAEDLMDWMAKQDFFNGDLVTNGESYPGFTQWQAARTAHPAMKGLTPHNAPLDFFSAALRVGGAWGFGLGTFWAFGMRARHTHDTVKFDWDKAKFALPLCDLDTLSGMRPWPLWHTWMDHPCRDAFWDRADAFNDLEKITSPAFITGGWYDAFLNQTLRAFTAMRQSAGSEKARRFTRLVMEPLDHDMRTGELDYGPDHLANIIETRNRFMKNILREPDADPLPGLPPMHFFVMGSNTWRDAGAWPLPETRDTPLYLHGSEPANAVIGGGKLSFNAPEPSAAEAAETFLYNPADPVPTNGGNTLGIHPGQHEQGEVEKRGDVLVFTSGFLEDDLDVIGWVRAKIFAATTAPDTDFTAKLCDVFPDGRSYNVCDGLVRGRFRSGCGQENFLTPGEVYEFDIDCWATAYSFLRGHRLRVQVSSSNFPRFDRNLNTGGHLTKSTEMRTARQTVLHDPAHPSHLVLPVIPKIQ